jgi:CheY-like chemotaxis protein
MLEKRALVVDDAEMNSELLSEFLSEFEFETDIASNGEEALDFLRAQKYSIVFMDHLMPVMDGIEAMHIIEDENLCPDTPVIMVTANDEISDFQRYVCAGFADYMKKPFSCAEVGEMLKKHLYIYAPDEDEWKIISEQYDFLDVKKARYYFLNDASLYAIVLREYSTSDIHLRLDNAIKSEDKDKISIVVRCIRDEARLIGAHKLDKAACDAEMALGENDDDEILVKCRKLMTVQKKTLNMIYSRIDQG